MSAMCNQFEKQNQFFQLKNQANKQIGTKNDISYIKK